MAVKVGLPKRLPLPEEMQPRRARQKEFRGRQGWFYTYILANRKGIPFYVGKGRDRRIYAHACMVKRSRRLCNPKLENKIMEITSTRGEIVHWLIHYSEHEDECLDLEKALIDRIGLANLCNLVPGGKGASMPIETRLKISHSRMGQLPSLETRLKMSSTWKRILTKGTAQGDRLRAALKKRLSDKRASEKARIEK